MQTTFEFLDDYIAQVRRFNQLQDRGSFPALATPFACTIGYKGGCVSATGTKASIWETTPGYFNPAD